MLQNGTKTEIRGRFEDPGGWAAARETAAGSPKGERSESNRQQPRRERDPSECHWQEELALHRAPEGVTALGDHLHDGGELPCARNRSAGLPD